MYKIFFEENTFENGIYKMLLLIKMQISAGRDRKFILFFFYAFTESMT